MKKTERIRLGKIALLVGLPILILFGLIRIVMNVFGALPDVVIPSHTMPAINARDYFLKAGGQLQSEKAIKPLLVKRAAVAGTSDHSAPDAEQTKLLSANSVTLVTLRQGLSFPYMEQAVRSFDTDLPYYKKYRSLGMLLRLEADARAAKGDYAGAVDSCLDAIQMGEMIPRGGTVIGMMVGEGIVRNGEKNCGKYATHLTDSEAHSAVKRLERIQNLHIPYSEVLTEEKYSVQGSMQELFGKPDSLKSLYDGVEKANDDSANKDEEQQPKSLKGLLYIFPNKRASFLNYTHYMDELIAAAKQPYTANALPIPIPEDMVCQMICPVFTSAGEKDREIRARLGILELRLAIRAYELDHGHLPDTLAQLVPAYLTHLPDDPHAAKGSYGYTRNKVGYTLFSTSGYIPPKPKKQH